MITFLQELFGPSWRSTTLGLLSILTGIGLFLIGLATGEATLKAMGLGLVPTGILGLVTRDNQASVTSHEESLKGIQEAKTTQQVAHVENAQKIDHLERKVDAVPAVVAEAVDTRAPAVIADVILPIIAAAVEQAVAPAVAQAVQDQPREGRR